MTRQGGGGGVCLVLAEEAWGSALQAARSLGGSGVPVYIATAGKGAGIYGRSRFCAAAADFEPREAAHFCAEVRDWMERLCPGDHPIVVLPLSDRLVEFLHQARELFPARYRLSIPAPAVTEALLTKAESFRIAERAGLDVPPWRLVATPEEVPVVEGLQLPVAVRPTSWAAAGTRYFKIAVCRHPEALRGELQGYLAQGAELVVQEYVSASEADVELAIVWRSADGSRTAICTGRKRRQSGPEGGVMVWGETTPLPDVRDAAIRFLDESGFTGLGGIEFIRSGSRPWFIEFNPRLEAIHFLAASAGVDTVRMAYEDLGLGRVPGAEVEQGHATAWIGSAWLQRMASDRSYRRMGLGELWSFRKAAGRVWAVWSPDDPRPWFALAARIGGRAVRSLLRRRHRRSRTAEYRSLNGITPSEVAR